MTIIGLWTWLGRSKWVSRWLQHASGLGVGLRIYRPLFAAVAAVWPELIFVNQGEFLGPASLGRLRSLGAPIVNHTNDNPFSGRDGLRFRRYLKALPHYDLLGDGQALTPYFHTLITPKNVGGGSRPGELRVSTQTGPTNHVLAKGEAAKDAVTVAVNPWTTSRTRRR